MGGVAGQPRGDYPVEAGDLHVEGFAPATIGKAYQILGRIFGVAVTDGLIPRSPCREVKLPRLESVEKRFLSPAEVEDLAGAIHARYRAFVLAGLHRPALRGAGRPPDRRLGHPASDVEGGRTAQSAGHMRMVPGSLKSKEAYRTIGIPSFLVEELAVHLSACPSSSNLVFSHAEGGPLDYNRFRRRVWIPGRGLGGSALHAARPPPHPRRHAHRRRAVASLYRRSPRPRVDQDGPRRLRTPLRRSRRGGHGGPGSATSAR